MSMKDVWDLPNGWRLDPYLNPLSGEPTTGLHWLVSPQGKRCTTVSSEDARAFVADLSRWLRQQGENP